MPERARRKTGILLSDEEKAVLELAEEECLLRIRNDQTRSSPQIRRLLVYLEHHLYDETLNVARWKAACSVRTNTFGAEFREDLDSTPYAYISERRLETAARLLTASNLKIWMVGCLVGYSDPAVFSRAFLRWAKMRPERFRQAEGEKDRPPRPPDGYPGVVLQWRSVFDGEVDLHALVEWHDRFHRLHPRSKARQRKLPSVDAVEALEKRRAERIWDEIKDRPSLEQILLVSLQGDFETMALFDLLREKSREEGRRDRQRGIVIAELALHSLAGCAAVLGEDLPNREAQGWITLGNARRLALDFFGADRDFEIGEQCWRSATSPDPLVEAELYYYRANLRWSQMSFRKARKLVDRAIERYLHLDHPQQLAQSLILRSGIRKYQGEVENSVPDLYEALELIDENKQPYLACAAYSSLTTSYLSLEKYEAAASAAVEVRNISRKVESPMLESHTWWLHGLVKKALGDQVRAERDLLTAIFGFQELRQCQYVCGILLELAMLYAESGRSRDALAAIADAIPVLHMLRVDREALAAVRLLRDAVATKELTLELLQEASDLIGDLLWHPLTALRLSIREKAGEIPALKNAYDLSQKIGWRKEAAGINLREEAQRIEGKEAGRIEFEKES